MNEKPSHLVDTVEEVLRNLEESLTVELIAEPELSTCTPDDIAYEVFTRPENAYFDQLPVKGDRIIGVLERDHAESTALVATVMKPLDDSMLIAPGTGLLRYIRSCADPPYRLLVSDGGVCGIVTPSDLLKLPVRTLLFTLLTHLEAVMAAFIEQRIPAPKWRTILKPGRMTRIDEKFDDLRRKNLDITKLLASDWADKRDLVKSQLKTDRRSFERDLKKLEDLRNALAHASIFQSDMAELSRLTTRAQFWIHQLDVWLSEGESAT